MMVYVNALLGVALAVLLLGVIGERNEHRNQNLTLAFCAVCLLIFAVNRLF